MEQKTSKQHLPRPRLQSMSPDSCCEFLPLISSVMAYDLEVKPFLPTFPMSCCRSSRNVPRTETVDRPDRVIFGRIVGWVWNFEMEKPLSERAS